MLGVDCAFLRDDIPGPIGPLLQVEDAIVLDYGCAALLGGAGISPDRARGVDIAFAIGPHAAENALNADDRAKRLDFVRRDQPNVLDPDRLKASIRRL